MVRGPMIAAVTTGWRITNAIAISIRLIPASSATEASARTASSLRAFSGAEGSNRDPSIRLRISDPGPGLAVP